jgi:hypothetical protein
VRHLPISLRLRGHSFSVVDPWDLPGQWRSALPVRRRPSESLVREIVNDPANDHALRLFLAAYDSSISIGPNYHPSRNEIFRRVSDLLASGRVLLVPSLPRASSPKSPGGRPRGPVAPPPRPAPVGAPPAASIGRAAIPTTPSVKGPVPVALRPGASVPGLPVPGAAPATPSPLAQMPLQQKMEIAIRNAPLSEGLRRELGDIKTLVATFVVVTGALLALAATGFGAAAEAIAIGFLLAGAVASGAQIGRGVNGLIAFYRQADAATSEEELNKAGSSFADGVAALGIGALFLLLTFLGARARGASGGGSAAEDSAKVASTPKTSSEPPPRPNEPTRVTRRIPEQGSAAAGEQAITSKPPQNSPSKVAPDKVKWVDESAHMSDEARDYQSGAAGARSNIATQKPQAPEITYKATDGSESRVRFDGRDGDVLIDRKTSVTTFPKSQQQALRQSAALDQNGLTGRWEVPTEAEKARANKMLTDLGIKNITVAVEPTK